ncbi:MAG: hypothetical protein JWL83_1327 [Actinomycetia bacterium]|nr:hypothetical protein [Actinomycetes bacterium]
MAFAPAATPGSDTLLPRSRAASGARAADAAPRKLFRDGYALGVSTVASAGLGFVAWVLAARHHTPREMGYASGLLQAVLLLSAIGLVNLSPALIRFLPVAGREGRRFIGATYVVSGTVTAVVAFVFALFRPAHLFEGASFPAFFGFALLATLWSIFTLQDAALTGVGAANWVAGENTVFGVLRVLGIVALGATGGRWGIVGSWFIPAVALIAVINLWPLRTRTLSRAPAVDVSTRVIGRYVTATWLPTVLQHVVQLVTPLVVLSAIGPTRSSAFSMAWLIFTNIELVGIGFGNALVVHAARNRDAVGSLMQAAVRRQLQILGPVLVGVAVFAHPILSVFGPSYARGGTTTLRLLALAMLPRIFSLAVTNGARVAGRLGAVTAIQLPITVGVVGLSALLVPKYGMIAVGWVAIILHSAIAIACIPMWRILDGSRQA